MTDPGRIVIIGAGPTGLGAAYRLNELGYSDVVVLEQSHIPGGLAASITDERGFTWDIGGHVQFSHYTYYDEVLDRAIGRAWLVHERESWIWIRRRFVPYPFQHNLHRLDPDDSARALAGLEAAEAKRRKKPVKPESFGDWITTGFGEGLAELFMRPYNFKAWGYPLESMDIGWMGERVALPDAVKMRAQIAEGRDEVSWGPNRTFRFPLHGGTGAIWRGVAGMLPAGRVRFNTIVVRIDNAERRLVLSDHREIAYDTLISTMPLDRLVSSLTDASADLQSAGRSLRFSSVHVLGIGLRGPKPVGLGRKCWMYFPEANSPYYRVTVFSHYSPHNVPDGDYWSLMAEVCESAAKPVDAAALVDDVVRAMYEDGLIGDGAEIVSQWHHRESHGYPTPFLGRDAVLTQIRNELEPQGIFSRGRFGAWKYEVSNQDHSFMQGVELVDRLLKGSDEVTLDRPDEANSGIFLKDRGR